MAVVSVARMKPTAKAIEECGRQLKRIADGLEMLLAYQYDIHMQKHKADDSGDEPQVLYTDEEADWKREYMEKTGQTEKEEE